MPYNEYDIMKTIPIKSKQIINLFKQGLSRIETANKLLISPSTLDTKCRLLNISVKNRFDKHFFKTIDTEQKAYWLGFLCADACIGEYKNQQKILSINLAIKDYDHLVLFMKNISGRLKVHITKKTTYIRIYSDILCNDLIKLGCTPRKSLTLQYPTLDPSLDKHFIRGYFDGDGCISKHNNGRKGGPRLSIIGTEQFLQSMQQKIFNNLNIEPKNKLGRAGKSYKYDNNAYIQVRQIMDWMYKDSTVFLLRKKNKYKELQQS